MGEHPARGIIRVKTIVAIILCFVLAGLISGCGCGGPGAGEKDEAKAVERITLESLDDVPSAQLADDVIAYVQAHPEKEEQMLNFAMYSRDLQAETKVAAKNRTESGMVMNTIPVVGGFIADAADDRFLEAYQKGLLQSMDGCLERKHALLEDLAPRYAKSTKIAEKCLEVNPAETLDNETYNAMMRISALLYRETEVVVEDAKAWCGLGVPDEFDIIGLAFDKALDVVLQTSKKGQEAHAALLKIYDALSMQSKVSWESYYTDYWIERIPRYIFAYTLETDYAPDASELVVDGHTNREDTQKIYRWLNGEWESLVTGNKVQIQADPKHDGKIYRYPKVGFVFGESRTQPYAAFYYDDEHNDKQKYFITPATYVHDDGTREHVLVLYQNYALLGAAGDRYMDALRIERMDSAEDVLIKRADSNGSFDGTYDAKLAGKLAGKHYLFEDRLEPLDVPGDDSELVTDNSRRTNAMRAAVAEQVQGTWTSLISGQTVTLSPVADTRMVKSGENIAYVACMSTLFPYARFDYEVNGANYTRKKAFLTTASDAEGGSVLVLYFGFDYVDRPDDASTFSEYLRLDNIASAKDVLIRPME